MDLSDDTFNLIAGSDVRGGFAIDMAMLALTA